MLFETIQIAMGNHKAVAMHKKNRALSQENYFILQKLGDVKK